MNGLTLLLCFLAGGFFGLLTMSLLVMAREPGVEDCEIVDDKTVRR